MSLNQLSKILRLLTAPAVALALVVPATSHASDFTDAIVANLAFKTQFITGFTPNCMKSTWESLGDKPAADLHVGAFCDCGANYVWNNYAPEIVEKVLKGEPWGVVIDAATKETLKVCLSVLLAR